MLAGLVWALAALVAAVVVLAATPVVLRLTASAAPEPRLRLAAAALGGRAPEIALYDSTRQRKPRRRKPRPGPARRRTRRAGPRAAASLGPALLRLGSDLASVLRRGRLRVEGRYGLGDPADTGALQGALAAAAPILAAVAPGVTLDLHPDFSGARLDGRIEAEARLTPAALLPPFARFAWRAWGSGPRPAPGRPR
jgi:hypothetical protein